ncbi:MAG: bifunctional serine/threonine-protein kinase/formylglycine-generating enzyme family protein [Alphaproteobacteria bacterium]
MARSRADALPEGTQLNVYTLGAVLGAGGFGITYRAIERITDRRVAIKEFLPTELAQRAPDGVSVRPLSQGSDDFSLGLDRFRVEARTLIALKHPNIVPVLQYFEANGTGYLVMEYQNGATLGERLRSDGPVGEADLRRIAGPLLDALEAVHGKGFLHRDIKPDNVFLREDGVPLLLDFGAARQAVGGRSRSLSAIYSEGYAPHEQYESDSPQGPWSDIYALGCTLYRCMTGAKPPSAPKRANAALEKRPDPVRPLAEAARGRYSRELVRAVEAAMRLAASERPQSVASFRALMAPPLDDPDDSEYGRQERARRLKEAETLPAPAPRPGPKRKGAAAPRRRAAMAGAALLASLAIGAAVYFGLEWYDEYRLGGRAAAAEAAIAGKRFDAAERELEAAARIRADDRRIAALRARLAQARRAEIGERNRPRLVLPIRDCADCPELVEIPPGLPFTMGAPASEEGSYPKERPQHAVEIAYPFLLGRYEVTVRQYRAFLQKSGRTHDTPCATFNPAAGVYEIDGGANWMKPDFLTGDDHPVVCVSWADARAYADWLSRETGKRYRLPSEAEWEYAARAGDTKAAPWIGTGLEPCQFANAADLKGQDRLPKLWDIFKCNDGAAFTAPVGSLKANAFGLHDMLGNAWEWVEDCHNTSYAGAPADGKPWLDGDCASRIMRGGGWISQVRDVRYAMRGYNRGDRGYYSAGFRILREK